MDSKLELILDLTDNVLNVENKKIYRIIDKLKEEYNIKLYDELVSSMNMYFTKLVYLEKNYMKDKKYYYRFEQQKELYNNTCELAMLYLKK